MQKHAIPQNIMDVEFKLFGSLTVRQFMSLSGGVIVAVFLYFLPISWLVKFPLMFFSVILGLAMAFVTVNGQPFSRWFSSFIRAMFSSQKYVWQKEKHTPKVFQKSFKSKITDATTNTRIRKRLGVAPIMEAISSSNVKGEQDDEEYADMQRINRYFEAEFGKVSPETKEDEHQVKRQVRRIDIDEQNLAGQVNPNLDEQEIVQTGPKTKMVFSTMKNQKSRRFKKDEIDLAIEEKVRQILEKQRDLDPFIRTLEVEEREKKLRAEMRELYNEIQQLKSKKHG